MVVSTTLEDIEDSWIIQQDFWRFEHKNDRIIRDTSISNMSKLATCYFDLDCLHSQIWKLLLRRNERKKRGFIYKENLNVFRNECD